MMAGFVAGIIIAAGKTSSGLGLIQILGLASFAVGAMGMFGKLPIRGRAWRATNGVRAGDLCRRALPLRVRAPSVESEPGCLGGVGRICSFTFDGG